MGVRKYIKMNMRFSILLALVVCSSYVVRGQVKDTPPIDNANISPTNVAKAMFQINDIKNKGIIVRLKTNKDRIAAYRKEGYKKVADQIEEKSNARNLLLVFSFVTEWTYSPVYFMESQHTVKLMQQDTLMAKTADLSRDTAIYINRDSFYLIDFGDLMANEPLNDNTIAKNIDKTQQSGKPVGDSYLVVKGHDQKQLQSPMPYETKVWFEEFFKTDGMEPLEVSAALQDSFSTYLSRYKTLNDLLRSDATAKKTLEKYLNAVYTHITTIEDKVNFGTNKQLREVPTSAPSISVLTTAPPLGLRKGNPFQNGVKRLNQHFIEYFCNWLAKDRNKICNDNEMYWWLRNPNMRYLPYLHDLELRLKQSLDKGQKFIAPH